MGYHMLLWRKPVPEKQFHSLCADTFQTMLAFTELGRNNSPNYLTGKRKPDPPLQEFEWTLENFENTLLSHPVNKGNLKLGQLGYSVSFFSSLDSRTGISFQVMIGNTDPLFLDTIVAEIPASNIEAMDHLVSVFQICAKTFQPYWGCVTETHFLVSPMLECDRPVSAHWLNYWSDDLLQRIGRDVVTSAFDALGIPFLQGFFQIRESPISSSSESDMLYFKRVNAQLRKCGVIRRQGDGSFV